MPSPAWNVLLSEQIEAGQLLQLVLSRPLQDSEVTKISVHAVETNGATGYQWTFRRGAQEFHQNLTPAMLATRIEAQFGKKFADLHWFSMIGDFTVRWRPDGAARIKRKPPSKQSQSAKPHNRQRNYLIPDGVPCPFLIDIDVMTPEGRVKPSMYHKFRQINRYLEFIDDVLPELPSSGPIHVVDFGCGKSYLTFALHHFLTRIRRRTASIVGLDRKGEVIGRCEGIARRLNCEGLTFHVGDIPTYQPMQQVHLAVSLHACDTATDDALAAAVRWHSNVILAVPCCQHELCQSLPGETLSALTGYGLFKERFAAMATDALRARYLECRGYKTQVVEFIELEHTPKNVLLRAVRRSQPQQEQLAEAVRAYHALKSQLGVAEWHLERAGASIACGTGAT